jgi:hypothetical protein
MASKLTPRLVGPMAGAYIFMADNPEPTDPQKYYNYIPQAWSYIDFTRVDVLYVGPGGVQYADGRFGLYDSEKKDSLSSKNPTEIGSLATRFRCVLENARKQNPKIKIMISQWPNSCGEQHDGRYWGFDWTILTSDMVKNYADSVKAFVKEWDIDGYDIDYEYPNDVALAPNILNSIRTNLDALSKESDGRPFYLTAAVNTTYNLTGALSSLIIVNMMSYGSATLDMFTSLGMTVDQLTYGFCAEVIGGNCSADVRAAIAEFDTNNLAGIFQWRLNSPEYMENGYQAEKEFQRQIYYAVHPVTKGKGHDKKSKL